MKAIILVFIFLPLIALADEGHPEEAEHIENAANGLDPIVGLIGVVLAVGVGFGVWVFMEKRNKAEKLPAEKKLPKEES